MKTPEEKRAAATERQRKWRAKNPEKASEIAKKSRAVNAEQRREDSRLWRKNNPEKAKAAVDRWNSNNPERLREFKRDWSRANSPKINAGRREQYRINRIALRIKQRAERNEKKQRLVDLMGGKCMDCGYNKCLGALEFDHINDDKERGIGALLNSANWERLLAEAKKCELVCSNCHKARHVERTDARLREAIS